MNKSDFETPNFQLLEPVGSRRTRSKIRVTFKLRQDQYDYLEALAIADGTSICALVREAVDHRLSLEGIVLPADKEV